MIKLSRKSVGFNRHSITALVEEYKLKQAC